MSWADSPPGAKPLPPAQLQEWVDSGVGGLRWAAVPGGKRRLTFRALISLRLIFRFHVQGAPLGDITEYAHRLKRTLDAEWPLASKTLWHPADYGLADPIPGKGDLPPSKQDWKIVYGQSFDWRLPQFPHGLEFDNTGVACAWHPAQDVKIEPNIMSGRPCITGTRIPTWVIIDMVEGGDSIKEIADWYELPEAQVQNAVTWEKQLATYSI